MKRWLLQVNLGEFCNLWIFSSLLEDSQMRQKASWFFFIDEHGLAIRSTLSFAPDIQNWWKVKEETFEYTLKLDVSKHQLTSMLGGCLHRT
ncbi:hypothetical protein [Pajaroellobacter abortibovis]|uniref:Uncharacterized protein n=1 Tax=Pajaroellobacter abortibovis TaxID=1882918 RepID=A0A1L6MYP2_9BACT|nr:hypothetical protein [Pajaroellobacter abortibovis]APS00535.1 hypothetical protein BCY86_07490 [Pajaroellobacter abortibovis]